MFSRPVVVHWGHFALRGCLSMLWSGFGCHGCGEVLLVFHSTLTWCFKTKQNWPSNQSRREIKYGRKWIHWWHLSWCSFIGSWGSVAERKKCTLVRKKMSVEFPSFRERTAWVLQMKGSLMDKILRWGCVVGKGEPLSCCCCFFFCQLTGKA